MIFKQLLSFPFLLSIFSYLGISLIYPRNSLAQVTPDGTTDTQVDLNNNTAEITGGETRGGNLFHSFQDFSLPTGREALFNNANDISNIFSRVTGGNISNIDGLIRSNGSANLFFINPAGIIFGENARLDIGGSFYGSTADSVLFPDGEFSATDLDNPPVLTVNAPIGLGFRDNPGEIVNSSIANNGRGLEVNAGNNLSLLGGNITFNEGIITAPGGTINLGGLAPAGEVSLNENGNFIYPDGITKANISFTNGALAKVSNAGGGFINVDANNLSFSQESRLLGGIDPGSGSPNARAGDIIVNAESIFMENNSQISTASEGIGNSGNIFVTATKIEFNDELEGDNLSSRLISSTFGIGDAGDIEINASEIIFDGSGTGAFSNVGLRADDTTVDNVVGDSGNITVNTDTISFLRGGRLSIAIAGEGNGGDIILNANESIIMDEQGDIEPLISELFDFEIRRASGINNIVRGALADSDPTGVGDAGNIEINTPELLMSNFGGIFSGTSGQGNAGDITINVTGNMEMFGVAQILSQVLLDIGDGNAGDITINANSLSIDVFSQIQADTQSAGDSGNIFLNAQDISITESTFINTGTGILGESAAGNAGNIEIDTGRLFISNSFVEAFTSGNGNAGDVIVRASESITLDEGAGITADVRDEGQGTGGDILLTAPSLSLSNGARLSTSTFAQGVGEAGSINVNVSDAINIDGASIIALTQNDASGGNINLEANTLNLAAGGEIFAEAEGAGNAGNINLEIAEDITLRTNSVISARAIGSANGGNVDIDARYIIAFPSTVNGNDIIASAEGGNGGNIILNAESLLGIEEGRAIPENETNELDASSEFSIDGNVIIETPDLNPLEGTVELPNNLVAPEEVTARACTTNNIARNSFTIKGKGGSSAQPGMPLNSAHVSIAGEVNSQLIPQAIETSQGKIQPARGIKVTESGEIILTAYRTDSTGDRLPETRFCS